MKSCNNCVHLYADPFVSPCNMCRVYDDFPHWSAVRTPITMSVVRRQAIMIRKLLKACHVQRNRARAAEDTVDYLRETIFDLTNTEG